MKVDIDSHDLITAIAVVRSAANASLAHGSEPGGFQRLNGIADRLDAALDEATKAADKKLAKPARREAWRIAQEAHQLQVDKLGEPYIEHVKAVVAYLWEFDADDFTVAAGWLHDVVEDHGDDFPLSYLRIRLMDASNEVVADEICRIVEALTHRKDEPRDDYYARIREAGSRAVQVKLADIQHNADPERLAKIADPAERERLRAKYERAALAFA